MKKMHLAVAAAALLGSVSLASAQAGQQNPPAQQGQGQQGQAGQQRGNRMLEALMQGITLTDKQKAAVDSITTSYRAQMPAYTPGTPMSDEDRAKMRDLRQKQTADIRAQLTADQQKTFDANLEQMRANAQNRGGRPPQ